MAVALSGAVVIKYEGTRVTYKKKCEKCGNVDGGTISTTVSSYSKHNSSFRCSKCGNNQKIVIQGSV